MMKKPMTRTKRMYSKGGVAGGKLEMVKNKKGEEVPFYAADGEGKMMGGGVVPKSKGYFKGGKVMSKTNTKGGKVMSKTNTKGGRMGGKG